jgi:putative ABC transport system permease protein
MHMQGSGFHPLRLVFKNIADSAFRSWVLFLCTFLLAAFAAGAVLVMRAADNGLQHVLQRLGADILVIPDGNQSVVEHAILMGVPARLWMPRSVVAEIAAVPGVEVVSPQLFLSTMRGASCCSVSDMFMIAYDPETDFTVRPWLEKHLDGTLKLGEAIGGHYVTIPEGRENILIYGYEIELAGSLEPTGSGLDQSMFFTYETALEIARRSPMQAERELIINPESISAALVRVQDSADPHQVAEQIGQRLAGVAEAVEAGHLFREQRQRVLGLLRISASLAGIAWVLSILLIGLVSSIALSGYQRQIGVLRALGASRLQVTGLILAEGALLALGGGAAGFTLAAFAFSLFKTMITRLTGLPSLILQPSSLLGLGSAILGFSLVSVILATLFPVLRTASREPGLTLKE